MGSRLPATVCLEGVVLGDQDVKAEVAGQRWELLQTDTSLVIL